MNPAEPDPDDALAGLLAAYDEVLAAGLTPPPPDASSLPPGLRPRLEGMQALLERLARDRLAATPPPSAPDLPTFVAAVPPAGGEAPAALGRFRIVRELGRGGGGVVFLAWDPRLRREVALKVPRPEALLTPELRQRFLREGHAAAGLDHPNVVPVYEAGEVGAVCYLASAYCPGSSLKEWLRRRGAPVPVRAAAALVAILAEAVHYTHGRGVLHRDLKPGNVLLVAGDRPQAIALDGDAPGAPRYEPRVTDFGLAKMLPDPAGPPADATRTGTVLGTPAYMAPEQAEGRLADVGPHTDVWALGVILYELLTGRLPFQGETDLGTLRQVAAVEPVAPRRLRGGVPRDLQTVCLKCLEKAAKQRYATAADLAEDLRRFLADEPIRARPAGLVRRLRKWLRRHPALLTALVLLLAFGGLVLAYRPRPPTPDEMDQSAEAEYRRSVAALQLGLARGRAVSLIGPTTTALPCRWRAGQGQVRFQDHPQEEGIVAVSALGPSLLELLPDPGPAAYRLVVELRQQQLVRGSPAAEVAVSFACSEHVTEEGPQLVFGRVGFADLGPKASAFRDEAGRPAGLFQLGYFLLGATHSGLDRTHLYGGPYVLYRAGRTDTPPGPWRRVEVEVRPGRLRARHWEGKAVELVPGREFPRLRAELRRLHPDLGGIDLRPTPRGPVGLFLEASVVSLRRFDVEPLGEGE